MRIYRDFSSALAVIALAAISSAGLCGAAFAEEHNGPVLRANDLNLIPGGSGVLRVELVDGIEPYAGVNGAVTLPMGVHFDGASAGGALGGTFTYDAFSDPDTSMASIGFTAYSIEETFDGGVLLNLHVSADASAALGDYSIAIAGPPALSNEAGTESIQPAAPTSELRIVAEHIPGDVDGSGDVTAQDIQYVINAVLGLDLPEGVDPDVNADGNIDALDIQFVINVVLGLDVALKDDGAPADPLPFGDVSPPVFPAALDVDGGVRLAEPDSWLAVRLESESPIEPGSVWGAVQGSNQVSETVEWWPISDKAGWAVYVPDTAWTPGDLVTMAASAYTTDGEPLDVEQHLFEVTEPFEWDPESAVPRPGYDASALPDEPSAEYVELHAGAESAELTGSYRAAGPVYAIGPDAVFGEPQRVWVPVPTELDPRRATVFYQHQTPESVLWYPADQVEGWLDPASYAILESDGQAYLGFTVRHGGLIQLGEPRESTQLNPAAGLLQGLPGGGSGMWLVLVLALTVIVIVFISWRAGRWGPASAKEA